MTGSEGGAAAGGPAQPGRAGDGTTRAANEAAAVESLFGGAGKARDACRAVDWARTPLGPVSGWSASLCTTVRLVLGSHFPMIMFWGPDYIQVYNDAFAPSLGEKAAAGRPGAETWAEVWEFVGGDFARARRTGEASYSENLHYELNRRGFVEETYFTYSHSPLYDAYGVCTGSLSTNVETTGQVLAQRRMDTLRLVAAAATEVDTASDACRQAAHALAENRHDLPFALLYLVESGSPAQLAAATGITPGTVAAPQSIDTGDGRAAWPIGRVIADGEAVVVRDLDARFPGLRAGPWPESPRSALLLPFRLPSGPTAGVLVAGLSPRLDLDTRYREFLELVAARVAASLTAADAREADRRQVEMLAELDRAKTEFFSNVSHEFRTPLTLILGPLERLRSRVREPELRAELDAVHRNGLRMGKLVNTLLDFSRVEAGRADARFEPVDLAVVTEGLASVFRSAMTRAGLAFQVDCAELPEPVYVDPSLWEKIVLNLLSNALKYTLAGSVRVMLGVEGDGVALRVADTGVGIPAVEMSRLFERFHRVGQTRTRSSEGSGIGLALARKLVELHGGTLTATSTVDVGSTFTVTLPLGHAHLPADHVFDTGTAPAPQPVAAGFLAEALRWLPDDEPADSRPPGSVASPPPGTARVLVVDDNADMRDYLHRLLSGSHQVRVVGDGRAALEAVRAELPDLILSDVMLPDIDGISLVRALRSQPPTASVPVVLLSARADQQAAVDGLAAGADDYQVKPFNAADLLARVDGQLRLSRVRREAERQFRALADATPALIWVDGPDGGRHFVNRAWSEFVGAGAGADPDPGWRDRIHPADRAQYTQVRTRAESRAVAFEVEYRLRSAAGTYRWVLDRGAPLGTAEQPRGYVGGCLDVDSRHRERERQRLLAAVTAELNRETTLQGQRSALVRTLVAENLVDIARVTSIDEAGQPTLRAFAGHTDEQRRLLAEMHPSVRQQEALSRGPVLFDVEEQYLTTTSPDPEQRDIRRRLDIRNSAVIPLSARGRVTEVFAACRTGSSAPLDEVEFALLVEIVERAAISMDNAQLLEHERFTSRRLESLQRATAGLSAAATPAQVAETAVAEFGRLLGAPAVAVFELRGPSLDALTMGGWSVDVRRDWSTIPMDAPAPGAVAARRREPVWLERREDWQRDYPDLECLVVDDYGYPGVDFLPMVAGGECLGVVVVGFRTERRMSPSDRAAASALADLCAQALQRSGLLAAENQARRAAEDLSKVVGALSGATSPDEVGAVILGHAAELGATGAAVVLRDGDQLTTLVTSTDGIAVPVELDDRHPLAYAARTGQPVWLASRSQLAWRGGGFATDQHELPIQVAVPLVVGRSVVGAIGLHFGTEPPAHSPAARSAILTFAGQCAQALDRARLHQAEHEVAEVLQRSLLPGQLPELARLAVATSYQPAARGTAAGGDWYDLLPISASRVAIAVGDVVGHGAPAAAVMGQLRSSLASYLLDGYGPADALERLDRFAARVPGALATTCACLTLDWDTGDLCYANAGHPPVLLLEPGRSRFLDEAGGSVLGVRGRAPYPEAGTRIGPGTTVLLYTDGLVERRHESLSDGLRRLAATAGPLAAMSPDELVATLAAGMPDDPAGLDDTAVVAVRLLPEPLRGRMPAASTTPHAVLEAARRWAELTALPAELSAELQLTLADAVADACDHADPDTPCHLDFEVAHTPDGGIEVSVADQGGWQSPAPPDDPARGRGLQLIRRLAERVEITTEQGTEIRFRLRPARARRRAPAPTTPAHTGAAPPGPGTPERRTWTLVDDLTAGSLDGARAELRDLLGGPGDVVIDLSAAGYLGSAAMGMLVEANHIAQDRGVRLSVRVALGSFAERAITITDLAGVLDIEWVT